MKRRTFLKATLAAVSVAVSGAFIGLRAAVAQVLAVRPRRRAIRLPPIPKWNKSTDDIDSKDFVQRSEDYERSLLPPDINFPRAGQIWESVSDCEVNFSGWTPTNPIFPGGMARLRQGERVRILTLDDPKPIWVSFQPVRYHALQESIVPLDIRNRPGYQRYALSLRTAYTVCCSREEKGYFHELFRLVEDAA
jgi:hypothetical protein